MNPKPAPTPIRLLDILRIRAHGDTRGRSSIDSAVADEYCELIEAAVEFTPIRAWLDGTEYWLVDGFHRVTAAKRIGLPKIAAAVFQGSLDDARWDSYSANSTHGVRRSIADVEFVIKRALEHPKSRYLSNYQIARHFHNPEASLRRWRKRLSAPSDVDTTRIAIRQGQRYTIETSKIGNRQIGSLVEKPFKKQLPRDFDSMKATANPNVTRVLKVVDKWLRNQSDAATFLVAMDGLIQSFGRSPNRHSARGLTVWFTGLSSAGESTIAEAVYKQLICMQYNVEW